MNLTTSDLGRHLANGEWFISHNPKVLTTNFYSYTFPDFNFINHHWGSGVVFYGIKQLLGFEGLSLFVAALILAAFLVIFRLTARKWGNALAIGSALVAIPLVALRIELRPEVFSFLFSAVFFWLLCLWQESRRSRFLSLFPVFMVFWVNLHVCFVFGFLMVGAFFLEAAWNYYRLRSPETKSAAKELLICLILCMAATLVNPIGWQLSLAPFQSFIDYGYRIIENQTPFFLVKRGFYFNVIPYFTLIPVVLAGIWLSLFKLKSLPRLSFLVIVGAFFILSSLAVRSLPLLGLFSIPLVASLMSGSGRLEAPVFKNIPLIMIVYGIVLNLSFFGGRWYFTNEEVGIGLIPKVEASALFFKEHELKGPIFNNYDIGSYLIYFLFPKERVFIDNRPEAFPSSFLKGTYVPMQADEKRWKVEEAKYGFNVIYFAWHDFTDFGQAFLLNRVKDPEWVPVFADDFALIFVKNVEANRSLIDLYRIPASRFGIAR